MYDPFALGNRVGKIIGDVEMAKAQRRIAEFNAEVARSQGGGKWEKLSLASIGAVRIDEQKVVDFSQEVEKKSPIKAWFDDVKRRNAEKNERIDGEKKWKKRLKKYENKQHRDS